MSSSQITAVGRSVARQQRAPGLDGGREVDGAGHSRDRGQPGRRGGLVGRTDARQERGLAHRGGEVGHAPVPEADQVGHRIADAVLEREAHRRRPARLDLDEDHALGPRARRRHQAEEQEAVDRPGGERRERLVGPAVVAVDVDERHLQARRPRGVRAPRMTWPKNGFVTSGTTRQTMRAAPRRSAWAARLGR